MPLDDPGERFDVCDADGQPMGITRTRADVHRNGDWHRSVHVWVVLTGEGRPRVLLQRRSLTKDTHPGKVDVSVAGHLRAGETVIDGLREAEEEIGLTIDQREVVRLGGRRRVDVGRGHIDREVQDILFVTTDRSLESLRPDRDEVSALLTARLVDLLALVEGKLELVTVREASGGEEPRDAVLHRADLLPDPDGYFAVALGSIARRLASASDLSEWVLDGSAGT